MPAHPYLDHPRPVAIAHRGGTEVAPENTLDAFAAAVQAGVRYLETDVHVTADGVLVAFHDERLDRVTDREGAIAELTWDEVSAARLEGDRRVPTLDDLLGSFPEVCLNIDPKSDDAVVPLVAALRRHAALDRVAVGAFSDRRLRRLRSLLGSGLCSAAGPRETASFLGAVRTGRPAATRRSGEGPAYDCLQVPVRHLRVEIVTPALVEAAHRQDLLVHVWTIDEADEMHRLLDMGVDGIMTDRPSTLREVLVGRGQWA